MTIEQNYLRLLNTPSDVNMHFPLIRKTVRPGDAVIELGVRDIVSSWALVANKPKEYCGVDVVNPPPLNLAEIRNACLTEGVKYTFIQGSSVEAILAPHDVLFIDTLHLYSHLVKELFRHAGACQRNIIFHDSLIPEVRAAIWDFLHDVRWEVEDESQEGTGCLVLRRVPYPV